MEDIKYTKNIGLFGFKSFKEIHNFAKAPYFNTSDSVQLGELKKSSYVKSIVKCKNKKNDSVSYKIEINNSKKIACGISHKILTELKKSNPEIQIKLDEELLDMDDDNELIFKSKNPLWVLKHTGSNLTLSRIF